MRTSRSGEADLSTPRRFEHVSSTPPITCAIRHKETGGRATSCVRTRAKIGRSLSHVLHAVGRAVALLPCLVATQSYDAMTKSFAETCKSQHTFPSQALIERMTLSASSCCLVPRQYTTKCCSRQITSCAKALAQLSRNMSIGMMIMTRILVA